MSSSVFVKIVVFSVFLYALVVDGSQDPRIVGVEKVSISVVSLYVFSYCNCSEP